MTTPNQIPPEQHERTLQRLQKFRGWLAAYEDLWKSMQVTTALCHVDGRWINLATGIILSEWPAHKRRIVVRPMPEFCAYSVSVPLGDLHNMLDSVVAHSLIPDLLPAKAKAREIHLNASGEWPDPRRYIRRVEYFQQGRYCMVFQSESGSSQNWLAWEFLERLEGRLGLKEPAFDGLADLYKKLFPHMNYDPSHLRSRTDIIAPLPLALSYVNGSVVLSAPENAFGHKVGLRLFFRPEGKSYFLKFDRRAHLKKGRVGMAEWHVPVKWPASSERSKAVLYFDEEKIDEIEIGRWKDAINARLAVDTYFDPGHERLKAALRLADPKAARPFELAVMKILNMLGVNAVSYVDEENNSDGAAVYDVVDGKSTVYLIECTIQKARAKFSLIRERAKRLKTVVGEAEVLPIVFVATDGEGDLQEAAELGITLVDSGSIETLIGLLERSASPEAVNQLFASLRANFPAPFRFR